MDCSLLERFSAVIRVNNYHGICVAIVLAVLAVGGYESREAVWSVIRTHMVFSKENRTRDRNTCEHSRNAASSETPGRTSKANRLIKK